MAPNKYVLLWFYINRINILVDLLFVPSIKKEKKKKPRHIKENKK
jgi:hypothetical protein